MHHFTRRSSPQSSEPAPPRSELSSLYRALDDAAVVLSLTDGVVMTARLLIRSIPRGAPRPISPLSVANAASERGVSPRTIHNHIRALEELGLVRDATTGRGRRRVVRNSRREIVDIAGIDLSPLEECGEDWARQKRLREEERLRKDQCRSRISGLRKDLSRQIDAPQIDAECRGIWESLPRRVAGFDLGQLAALECVVSDLRQRVSACQNSASDQSEIGDRPYTAHRDESVFSAMLAENEARAEADGHHSTAGLEKITLSLLLDAAPDDWIALMDQHGQRTLTCFTDVAYQRAREIGIRERAWALAERALGHAGAAVLVMVADALSVVRGGPIHNPGGWISRVADHVAGGTVDLYAKVLQLQEQKDATWAELER